MSKIAFICDEALSGLFESLGIDTIMIKEKENPCFAARELVKKGYGIIYILEKFAASFVDQLDAIRKEGNVSIVLIPDHMTDLGLGMALTRLASIDAIGTDAIFAKKEDRP